MFSGPFIGRIIWKNVRWTRRYRLQGSKTKHINQWERGEKHPRGPSLKLLSLVQKKRPGRCSTKGFFPYCVYFNDYRFKHSIIPQKCTLFVSGSSRSPRARKLAGNQRYISTRYEQYLWTDKYNLPVILTTYKQSIGLLSFYRELPN
jgi:hypothetical protein